jgi:hypothetical protein
VHPRQNLADKPLPAQDASVGEERVFAGLFVVGHTPARVFLIFGIRDVPAADELRPVLVVVAFVEQIVTVSSRLGDWRGVNEELVADEINDAHSGCGPWLRVLALLHSPLAVLRELGALEQVG